MESQSPPPPPDGSWILLNKLQVRHATPGEIKLYQNNEAPVEVSPLGFTEELKEDMSYLIDIFTKLNIN